MSVSSPQVLSCEVRQVSPEVEERERSQTLRRDLVRSKSFQMRAKDELVRKDILKWGRGKGTATTLTPTESFLCVTSKGFRGDCIRLLGSTALIQHVPMRDTSWPYLSPNSEGITQTHAGAKKRRQLISRSVLFPPGSFLSLVSCYPQRYNFRQI